MGLAGAASAAAPATSSGPSSGARAAWDRGDWKHAASLYKQTIEGGGLTPEATLEAYVRLGTAEALLKDRNQALVAYRHAALLNPKFTVPSVGGHKANALAVTAKKQEAKIGAISLDAQIPAGASAGVPLDVATTVDADHAAILTKIEASATDASGKSVYASSADAATTVHFTIPATAMVSGSVLTVRVDALDTNANQLAAVVRTVNVGASVDATGAASGALAANSVKSGASGSSQVQAPNVMFSDVPPGADKAKKDDGNKGGGFWSSPWPYVIGGLALAGAGAALYVETRPGDDVSVGAAHVTAR